LGSNNEGQSSLKFEDYLLSEYQNVAEAHFRTIEAISSFFRYYLIIMGVPFTLYAVIIALSPQMAQIIYALVALTAIVSVVISLVGFFVTLYIVNLRMDVVLYARTVNGIRKHFYDEAKLDVNSKLRMRILPQTATLPGYFEFYFLPVVISFAIFNAVYFFIGMSIFFAPLPKISEISSFSAVAKLSSIIPISIWSVALFFFLLHLIAYGWIARRRELIYLKSYSVGVDIDGVLNKHREHFCKLLHSFTRKQLDPDAILRIPVHEDPRLRITEDDEKTVFDNPQYWTEMPCAESAALSIRKLRNGLKLKIRIFTYRPFPSEKTRQNKDAMKEWRDTALRVYKESNFFLPRMLNKTKQYGKLHISLEKTIDKVMSIRMGAANLRIIGIRPIDIMTRCWLQKNGIEYDAITIERGSEDVADPQGHFRNRFYVSRKKKIRFFVEDDAEKANKLAYICDVVFLMEQPYNMNEKLPSNVVRVGSWNELYCQIRKYS
jgi:uncharacterized HAD superfamily protein